jgi:hypothetical protein
MIEAMGEGLAGSGRSGAVNALENAFPDGILGASFFGSWTLGRLLAFMANFG